MAVVDKSKRLEELSSALEVVTKALKELEEKIEAFKKGD